MDHSDDSGGDEKWCSSERTLKEELTGLLTDWGVSEVSAVTPGFCPDPLEGYVVIQRDGKPVGGTVKSRSSALDG